MRAHNFVDNQTRSGLAP